MPKYRVHYKPFGVKEDIRADVEAPSYHAAALQIRRSCRKVIIYSVTDVRQADVAAAIIGETKNG